MFDYQTIERPYPGLRPFEPWETGIFFGRDIHIDRLQDILKKQHFLTVTGPSGSGKSSLVRAGLLPALPLGAIGTGSNWRAVIMRPGDKPLSSLAKALCGHFALGPELERIEPSADSDSNSMASVLEAELRRGPLGLIDLVNDLRRHAPDPDFNLLILVDQFEEIFTYAEAGVHQADESDAFVNLLLAAGKNTEAQIFMVITMRTDFLGACTRFLDLPDTINRTLYLTPRLSREQLTEAIAGPARLFGMELPSDLVAEYVNASQNDPDQLPVLQHALARRWDQTREKNLKATETDPAPEDIFRIVGDLGKALSEHAEAVYQTLSDAQRLDAQWLFRAITEKRSAEAGGQMVRRPISLARIAAWSGRPWTAFAPIIQAFADPKVSFLSYNGQPGEPAERENTVIDLSHEAVMRQWSSLKNWVDSEGKAAQEFSEWRQRAERKENGNGAYLGGADLSRAEIWLKKGLDLTAPSPHSISPDSTPNAAWASRYCSLQEDAKKLYKSVEAFILQSRDNARFLQRFLFMLATFLIIAGVASAGFGYVSYQKSLDSAAKTLWFPLQAEKDLFYGSGANRLNQVAEQDEAKRYRFIEEIANDENIAARFASDYALLLRASIKSNLKLRGQLIERLRSGERQVKDSMLAGWTLALCGLEDKLETGEIMRAISGAQDSSNLEALGQCFSDILGEFNDAQAAAVLPRVLEAVQNTTDGYQLQALGAGLAAVAGKLNDAQATAVVAKYVETVQNTTDFFQFQALGVGLAAVTGKLNNAQAAAVLPRVLEAMQNTADPFQFQSLEAGEAVQNAAGPFQIEALVAGLAAVTGKLNDAQAAAVLPRVLEAMQNTTNSFQLQVFEGGEVVQNTTDAFQLEALETGLAAVAGKLNDAQAAAVVAKYVETVQNTTDVSQLQVLGKGLAAVAGKLNDAQAAAVVAKYVETVQNTTEAFLLQVLGKGLAAVAGKLNDAQAAAVLPRVLEAVQNTTDGYQLQALGAGLASAAGELRGEKARTVSAKLIKELRNTSNGANKAALALGANKLIPNLTLRDEQARAWLQISDIPFINRDAVAAAIRKQYKDAPREDQRIWTFLKWANSRFGVNRPQGNERIWAYLQILLLPLGILIGGGLLMRLISGRRLVAIQMQKLEHKKDRQGLGLRFQGYNAEEVKTHWSVLRADERVIERRFLWMDQVFAPLYGLAFYYALIAGLGVSRRSAAAHGADCIDLRNGGGRLGREHDTTSAIKSPGPPNRRRSASRLD